MPLPTENSTYSCLTSGGDYTPNGDFSVLLGWERICNYTASGDYVNEIAGWLASLSAKPDDGYYMHDSVIDSNGHIYIAYTFADSTKDWRNQTPGSYSTLIIKVNLADGSIAWAKNLDPTGCSEPSSITLDGNGNILVAGYTYYGMNGQASHGGNDGYLATLDANSGDFLASNVIGSSGSESASQAIFDQNGNLYLGGDFASKYFSLENSGYQNVHLIAGESFTLQGDGNDNVIDGGAGDDTIYGGNGNDELKGGSGNDTVDGGIGNDLIVGGDGAGDDTYNGGAGIDTVKYTSALAGITVSLTNGKATSTEGNDASHIGNDTLTSIENIIAGHYNDNLTGSTADNEFTGEGGDDRIDGRGGNDTAVYRGKRAEYTITYKNNGTWTVADSVAGRDGTDTVSNVEKLQFTDQAYTLAVVRDTFAPTVSSIVYGTNDGKLALGEAVTLTVNLSEAVNVTGTPTFALNNGGKATYSGGTGTDTLTFSYTPAVGQSIADLATKSTGAFAGTIKDLAGNAITATGFNNINPTGTLIVDVAVPTVSTFSPSDGATGVAVDSNIVLTFSEAIQKGTGTIYLRSGSATGTIVEQFDAATSTRLSFSGSSLTIDPTANLSNNTQYFVTFASGTVKDLAGNNYAGTSTYDFRTALAPINGTAGDDTLTGTSTADVINGLEGNDFLIGLGGDDSISGGLGNDWLKSGLGNDILNGGDGRDWADYSKATASISVSLLTGKSSGADGVDTLISIENIRGSDFNDSLTGDAIANWLRGGLGSDNLDGGDGYDYADYAAASASVNVNLVTGKATGADGADTLKNIENIRGSGFNDTLVGNGVSNFIRGGLGNDTIDGGTGSSGLEYDFVDYFDATGSVTVNLETGTSSGADGNDTIANIENIRGGVYSDTLIGNSGDNALRGGLGNDTLNGGLGQDRVEYTEASGAVVVNLTTGLATGADGNDVLISIEKILGSAHDDTLIGDSASNVLAGGAGNDLIDGMGGQDRVDYSAASGAVVVDLAVGQSSGSDGVDTLINVESVRGSRYIDNLYGDNGNNWLHGDLGNDLIDGRDGSDVADYWNAAAAVTVNLTINQSAGADGIDNLISIEGVRGGYYNDTLIGNTEANYLNGNLGDDVINGGGGVDTMNGDNGSDLYIIAVTDDHSAAEIADSGASGTDEVRFTATAASTLTLYAGDTGIETVVIGTGTAASAVTTATTAININASAVLNGLSITGNAGANSLTGTAYADTLFGNAGNDTLVGGDGNDTLNGGIGADSLTGGSNKDTFVFAAGNSGQATNFDIITDFAKGAVATGDLIDYTNALTIGGSSATATSTQASINTTTGIATFATSSGTTLSDALADIAGRFTAATNTAGEFAFFKVNNTGNYYVFISDGTAGVTTNDVVIQLTGITSITGINLTSGNLGILS